MKKTITGIIGVAAIAALVGIACNDAGDSDSAGAKAFLDRYHGGEKPVEPVDSCAGNTPAPGCTDTAKTYTITFNPNGGTVSPTSNKTGADGKLDSLPEPTRDDYNFDGWYTAETGGTFVTKNSVYSADTTIYARWSKAPVPPSDTSYMITFAPNGGTVSPASAKTGTDGKLDSLPEPTRDGYNFDGWYTAETGGATVADGRVFGADATIYAQWTLKTYTIKFNANSGTVTPETGTTGEGWKLTSLPTPTKSGYTFKGWYTATMDGTIVTKDTAFTKDTTIYAQWTLTTYTITFNPDGGNVSPTSDTTDNDGTLAELPTPTKDSFRFDGWFTTGTGGSEVTTSTQFTANTTIYAHWTRVYTVKFNSQRDSTYYSTEVEYKSIVSEPNTPDLADCAFGGWYTEVTCDSNTKWDFNKTVESGSGITLYAKWTVTISNTTYRAVRIGTQTWMAENLNSTVSAGTNTCYQNSTDSCDKYGRLYELEAASKACPAGWHLPDTTEWNTLIRYVGDSAGIKLKSKASDWKSNDDMYKGIDKYGFSALPGCSGSKNSQSHTFENNCATTKKGTWWSATKKDDNNGASSTDYYNYGMSANSYYSPSLSSNVSTNLYSVRCVR